MKDTIRSSSCRQGGNGVEGGDEEMMKNEKKGGERLTLLSRIS